MAGDAETAWVRSCVRYALGDDVSDDGDAIWPLLTPAQRAGHAPLPDPLPAAHTLIDRLALRLDNLPPAHRRALLIAGVAIVDRTDVLAAASGLTLDELVDGTLDGLISFVSRRYRLSDPRVRIVAHATATVAERTDAHTRLSAALADSSPHEAAWHRSLAALGGLPDVVPRLLGLSRQALRRGDSVFAYRVAREAASQSEPGRLRTVAQLRAGLSALHSGHAREAREWLGAVLRSGDVMLEASALAAFVFSVAAADGHVPHADLDRLEARWRADVGRGRAPGSGRGVVLGLATAAALHAERGDATAARAFGERARELADDMSAVDGVSSAPANDIVAGVCVWLAACGVVAADEAAWTASATGSADPTVAAGISLVDAFAALLNRGAAGARDASHALADSLLSLSPLDREAGRDGGTRGSATPLVEAHLRVAHWIVEQAGTGQASIGQAGIGQAGFAQTGIERAVVGNTVDAPGPSIPRRRGPVSDPGDPLLSRLPLHLPFGGTFVRKADASPVTREFHTGVRAAEGGGASERGEAPKRAGASESAPALEEHDGTAHPLAPVQRLFPDDEPAWLAALTARETEVARLVVGGASNREIAGRMHLSVRTVEVHLGRVFQKLDVHSRTQLSLLVHRGGYVETRS